MTIQDFPCIDCEFRDECPNFPVFQDLVTTLQDPGVDEGTKALVDRGLALIQGLVRADQVRVPLALGALFDLVVNIHYVRASLGDDDWIYCPGRGDEGPSFYFSFVGSCPRHSAAGEAVPVPKDAKHKPGAGAIGRICGDVYFYMLSRIVARLSREYSLFKSTSRDVDALLFGPDLICMLEAKASPLVAYPLEVRVGSPVVLSRGESEPREVREHVAHDVPLQLVDQVDLYVPHVGTRIPLGKVVPPIAPTDDTLFRRLAERLTPESMRSLVEAWTRLFRAYEREAPPEEEDGEESERPHESMDPSFWLTFGCGRPPGWPANTPAIDDGKNRPGIDRTDDIKKGTYQVLKMGTDFKTSCRKSIIRTALGGNFHAVTHHPLYLEKMDSLKWTLERWVTGGDAVSVPRDRLFNLYDALLCLTETFFRDDEEILPKISSLTELEASWRGSGD